jgi:hypothetical protein
MSVEVRNLLKATCDGPSCAEYHKQTVVLEWDDTQPETVPDDVYRIVTVALVTNEKKSFCSALCARDWLEKEYKHFVFPDDNPHYKDKNDHGDVVPVRILTVDGKTLNFSSAASAKDYLATAYVPTLSPREQEARDKAENKTESTE